MARPSYIEVGKSRDTTRLPILYEDRSVIAIDKPAGWLLVPYSWDRTPRNLQAAITDSIQARCFWAQARNLKCLRHVHRLDGDTTGILLLAKSPGAVNSYADLFESRRMEKVYLAVVEGAPREKEWTCQARLNRDPDQIGRMILHPRGKESETRFRLLQTRGGFSLIEARPLTGRTHQIRLHLLSSGHAVVGDRLYGPGAAQRKPPLRHAARFPMGLRAVGLGYSDPFLRKRVRIRASTTEFLEAFGLRTEE
jgi:RluA family pseudouridine synthase